MKMDGKSRPILMNCEAFFRVEKNAQILLDILCHRNLKISLRSIEKFVTKFAKTHGTSYVKNVDGKLFQVHIEYKSSLSGYSKKYFDPFCRSQRIKFEVEPGNVIETTVGQLNFIKWVIKNGITDLMMASD